VGQWTWKSSANQFWKLNQVGGTPATATDGGAPAEGKGAKGKKGKPGQPGQPGKEPKPAKDAAASKAPAAPKP
jgi:hypothetical protein